VGLMGDGKEVKRNSRIIRFPMVFGWTIKEVSVRTDRGEAKWFLQWIPGRRALVNERNF
jgi:hypothetical protein